MEDISRVPIVGKEDYYALRRKREALVKDVILSNTNMEGS